MPSPVFDGLTKTIFATFKERDQATYTPAVGPSKAVDLIFLLSHREVDLNGIPYGASRPVAWVRVEDIPSPDYNDQVDIGGTIYLVREIEFDGLETNKLILSRQ